MEIWKDVKGYEGHYLVSNLGRVNSLKTKKGKMLIPQKGGVGYLIVNLCKNAKAKSIKIHQLVAIAFLNHRPNGFKLVVNHIDNNKTNNRLENLEIVTNRENTNRKNFKCSSKYIGVSWANHANKWIVHIYINGKNKHLGYFTNELKASEAYQSALQAHLQ